jgi:predicted nucleic acid-binding protein
LVIDASVAVEYLLRTRLGNAVAPRLEGDELIAPELVDAEVLAVLRRAARTGEVAEDRAEMALADLMAWGLRRLPHRLLVQEAWSFRHNVSAYEALYLAVARLHTAPVLTADGPLARAPTSGVVVENVRVDPSPS